MTSRRNFLAGLGSFLVAAPAIVHAGNLMPIKAIIIDPFNWDEVYRRVAIGYEITRNAIDEALFGSAFPCDAKFTEITGTNIPLPGFEFQRSWLVGRPFDLSH